MTGDTNPTTPAAVEWTAAEREAVREAAWRFHSDGTPPARREAILAALAPFVAERERQAAARALAPIRCYAQVEAITAKANGREDRAWLDLLAIIEREGQL